MVISVGEHTLFNRLLLRVRCDWLANRRIAEVLRGALAVRGSPFGGWRHTALTITLTPNLNPFRPWCPQRYNR